MAVFSCYADTSGPHGGYISVGSYVFEKDKADQLDQEWANILGPILNGKPPGKRFFRMANFWAREKPFDKLSIPARDRMCSQLIESARRCIRSGRLAAVNLDAYSAELLKPEFEILGSAYAMCNLWCAESLADELAETDRVLFTFENGDPGEAELEGKLREISESHYLTERFKYHNHAFVPKSAHYALGAADMLAWGFRNRVHEYFGTLAWPIEDRFFETLGDKQVSVVYFNPLYTQLRAISEMVHRANRWAAERAEEESLE